MTERQRVNILMVDDQPAKLLSYEVILQELGENLIKANSADEALSKLLTTEVAVLLVDVCMPDLDGFQLVEMIREHPRFENIAIIFISAIQLADVDRLRGYQSGAVDYLPVPFAPEILRAKVRVFVELHRKSKQLEQIALELERRVEERTAALESANGRLKESDERLRQALSAANMGTWRRDLSSQISIRDGSFNAIFGLPPVETIQPATDRLEFVHPDDRVAVAAAWGRAVENKGAYEAEFRIVRHDGTARWVREQGHFVPSANGRPDLLTGLILDITQRKKAEERQELLIQELNHRVKNMLAVVQSIATQSLNGTCGHERELFISRIHALATCHDLLTRSHWEGAHLRDILDSTIAPHGKAGSRVVLAGEDALLSSRDALSITLAFHELATNAVKHGALTNELGRVHVSWRLEQGSSQTRLHFDWREDGGPPVKEPTQVGFGSRLLKSLAAQSGAAYIGDFAVSGFQCKLTLPLEARA